MKTIIILAVMLTGFYTVTNAAEPNMPVVTTATPAPCNVYASHNSIVIESNNSAPVQVTITGKHGTQVTKTTVTGKQQIPVKDLREGKYVIKLKTSGNEQTIKMSVL